MWPQSTLDEVRAAQELADAGDPAYTWQLEPRTRHEEFEEPGQVELVDRFLREVLGWEGYLLYPGGAGRPATACTSTSSASVTCGVRRAARTRSTRPGPDPERGEQCAPTIDEFNYETVSLDLVQLDRRGHDGIWVVNRWETTKPFAQADPVIVEAQAGNAWRSSWLHASPAKAPRGWFRSAKTRRRSAPVRHLLGCPVRAIRDRAGGRAAVALRAHDLLGPAVRGR